MPEIGNTASNMDMGHFCGKMGMCKFHFILIFFSILNNSANFWSTLILFPYEIISIRFCSTIKNYNSKHSSRLVTMFWNKKNAHFPPSTKRWFVVRNLFAAVKFDCFHGFNSSLANFSFWKHTFVQGCRPSECYQHTAG